MSRTDQAFIDAYRRRQSASARVVSEPSTPQPSGPQAAAPVGKPRAMARESHGPHVSFGTPRVPLSEVMRQRAEEDEGISAPVSPVSRSHAESRPQADPMATTRLLRFAWPALVDRLTATRSGDYTDLLDSIKHRWPVVGFAACHAGCGATTTTMVVARLLASAQTPVAVIDAASDSSGLASQLGVAHQPTLAETLAEGAPLASAMIHADEDHVSLLVAGPVTQHPAVLQGVFHQLRQSHAAVLVDLGGEGNALPLRPEAGVLVYAEGDSDAVLDYRCQTLISAGLPLVGSIENLARAA